ncbi:MAG TPA: ABC transporter ATP-binding protein [Acidiphilium sp.]
MKPDPDVTSGIDADDGAIVSVRNLKTYFQIRGSVFDRLTGREAGIVKAVDDISFDLRQGEVLGLVGESGSGKSTLGRSLLGLVPATGGSAVFEGQEIVGLGEHDLRKLRSRMQMVFQDPHAALNPAMTIEQSVGHPLTIHGRVKDRADLRRSVVAVLERVGLAPAEHYLEKYPGDLSGGQKQRAVIARAIILDPVLLVADEPVSMLDMSVRSKILQLMLDLKHSLNLTYLYITHDLATAKFFCDRIAIMYLGRIVEIGPAQAIYENPRHPYTKALLQAIPDPDPSRGLPRDLPRGEIPDAARPPHGCAFHPRCPAAFAPCGWEIRDFMDLLEAHWTRSPEAAATERALIGRPDIPDRPVASVRVPTAPGVTGEQLLALIERIRAEDPAEPFWTGVVALRAGAGHVEIEWEKPFEPRLLEAGRAMAACHLCDPALASRRPVPVGAES